MSQFREEESTAAAASSNKPNNNTYIPISYTCWDGTGTKILFYHSTIFMYRNLTTLGILKWNSYQEILGSNPRWDA